MPFVAEIHISNGFNYESNGFEYKPNFKHIRSDLHIYIQIASNCYIILPPLVDVESESGALSIRWIKVIWWLCIRSAINSRKKKTYKTYHLRIQRHRSNEFIGALTVNLKLTLYERRTWDMWFLGWKLYFETSSFGFDWWFKNSDISCTCSRKERSILNHPCKMVLE